MLKTYSVKILIMLFSSAALYSFTLAQPKVRDNRVHTVTIPISIFTKDKQKDRQPEEFLEVGNLIVREDGDEQTILSIRSIGSTPLALAILIQDNLSSSFNLELDRLADFIRRLPRGSRVMVAYLRGGTIQVRQKFTEDLERTAKSLRVVASSSAVAPSSPYDGVSEALKRFDALPTGKRAILLVSDGLDVSRGIGSSLPSQSLDLDQAILKAQRKSVAVYSFYTPTVLTESGNSRLALNGQGSLERLSDETGGRAFFQGTGSPVSFDPFFKDLTVALNRQFVLTYLSTHSKKGYHKVQVISTNPQVSIEHPKGYFYK